MVSSKSTSSQSSPPDLALSPVQAKVYQYLKGCFYNSGSMPTLREICKEMGWSAVGSAQDVLEVLQEKGLLGKDPQKARGLYFKNALEFRAIPILGSAPAGSAVESHESHEGDVILPGTIRGPVFAVRVRGDSMIDAGIENEDLVIVRQTSTAHHNDIVVAMLEGEVTIKRLSQKRGEIWLVPENKRYAPRKVMSESFRILGKVIGIHRYWEN